MLQFGLFSFFSVDIRKIETSSTQIQMMKNSSVFACAWNDRTSSRSLNIADGFFSFFSLDSLHAYIPLENAPHMIESTMLYVCVCGTFTLWVCILIESLIPCVREIFCT